MKRLIINADDFGNTEGVVRGIIELHEAGVVSSTSCMTNMPAWPQAAAYLREHAELGAGVHLVFNAGQPVLPVEQVPALLAPDGYFLNDSQILRSLRRGTTAQLRAEFRAQIERFIADAGRPPDHLDNHCAISYVRPDRFKVTLELAREYSVPIRAPFGNNLKEQAEQMGRIWGYPAWTIRLIGSGYRRWAKRAGMRSPNAFLQGFSPAGPRTVENLLHVLDSARDGWISEFLTHPGYDSPGYDHLWREEELRALVDPQVKAWLDNSDVEVVSFTAV
jgi:predicted glycoside hydrolase/deacetylase ChbG (UPF0249 family)